jgi:hypothetical protein
MNNSEQLSPSERAITEQIIQEHGIPSEGQNKGNARQTSMTFSPRHHPNQ